MLTSVHLDCLADLQAFVTSSNHLGQHNTWRKLSGTHGLNMQTSEQKQTWQSEMTFCAIYLSYGWLCRDCSPLFIYLRKKKNPSQPGIIITEEVLRLKTIGQERWLTKTIATRTEDISLITGSHTLDRTPTSCPLTAICALWHTCIHMHNTNK